jgi:hypothetical protein
MMKRLVLFLFVAALPIRASLSNVNYFPPGTLENDRERWYSRNLAALKEPSLYELSKDPKRESYRFLWLRTFNHPIAVRVDVNESGSGLMTIKESNGRGGYAPGALFINKSAKIDRLVVSNLLVDQISSQGFWNLSTEEPPPENVVQLDGAQWILEAVRGGQYKLVDRWSPKEGPVRNLGILMAIDLAHLKLLYEEVY